MNWLSGIFLYLIIWWTALFAVLPWGVRPPAHVEPGNASGAPENPRLKQKFIATTIVAAVIWLIVFGLVESDVVSFREMVRNEPD